MDFPDPYGSRIERQVGALFQSSQPNASQGVREKRAKDALEEGWLFRAGATGADLANPAP